jgi:hypothetical protein
MTVSTDSPSRRQDALLWTATALAGLAYIALMLWLGAILPAESCSPAQSAGSSFWAFQAAKTPEDIWAIFGTQPSPCRTSLLAAMDRVNSIDLYAYVPSYGLMLLGFLVASRHPKRSIVFWLGLAAIAVTVLGDVVETSAQLSITAEISSQQGPTAPTLSAQSFMLLAAGNTAKTNGLPFVYLALALLWFGRGVLASVLAVVLLLGPGLRLYGLVFPVPPIVGQLANLFRAIVMEATAIGMAMTILLPKRKS